jgi:hypothetical protein
MLKFVSREREHEYGSLYILLLQYLTFYKPRGIAAKVTEVQQKTWWYQMRKVQKRLYQGERLESPWQDSRPVCWDSPDMRS